MIGKESLNSYLFSCLSLGFLFVYSFGIIQTGKLGVGNEIPITYPSLGFPDKGGRMRW